MPGSIDDAHRTNRAGNVLNGWDGTVAVMFDDEDDDYEFPPTQYLMLETLAARWRLGEVFWTFPKRMRPIAQRLEALELVTINGGNVPYTIRVALTDLGRRVVLSDTYDVPATD